MTVPQKDTGLYRYLKFPYLELPLDFPHLEFHLELPYSEFPRLGPTDEE